MERFPRLFVENFQSVVAKRPVMRLLDTSRIEMDVSVPEGLIGLVPYVRSISVTFSSLPGVEVAATISKVGSEASLTTRTYPVTIVMDQPEGAKIQPGMAGRASVIGELPPEWFKVGVEVPAGAVFSPNDSGPEEAFVWIIDTATSTVSSRPVKILSVGDRGLMIRGVEAGERIVTAGANVITEGQQVRVMPE